MLKIAKWLVPLCGSLHISITKDSGKPDELYQYIQEWATCLVSSADYLSKQFGPRSGPTKCRS